MSKKYKPIYECDNCHIEFEDSKKVRCFTNYVTDGENKLMFIDKFEAMYCLECIPKILRLNEDYSDVYERTEIEESEIEPIKEEPEVEEESKIELVEEAEEEPEIEETEAEEEPEIEKTEAEEEPESEIIKEEKPETTKDFFKNEIMSYDDGIYLILYKITNEEQEEYIAKLYGHKDANSLRETYGKSLIGLYISSDSFVNELPAKLKMKQIPVINKIIFGVPNVVEKDAYIDNEYAYIEKNKFNLNIEPALIKTNNEIPITKKEEQVIKKEEELDEEEIMNIFDEDIEDNDFVEDIEEDYI